MQNRILVVDDDSSVRASLKKVLEQSGFEVELAASGQEALYQLESKALNLILLDLNLPDRNGWDLLELITRRSPTLPMIVITGLPSQRRAREIATLAPVLEKPLDASVLLATIQQMLREPAETRLRKFCDYLETCRRIPAVGATYLERLPRYPTSTTQVRFPASEDGSWPSDALESQKIDPFLPPK